MWQPISTAPKDGTRVYLRLKDRLGAYDFLAPCAFVRGDWWNCETENSWVKLLNGPVACRPIVEPHVI